MERRFKGDIQDKNSKTYIANIANQIYNGLLNLTDNNTQYLSGTLKNKNFKFEDYDDVLYLISQELINHIKKKIKQILI